MPLTVAVGAPVTYTVDGHSALNGAPFPDGSSIAFASNDPTVATVPGSVPLASGQSEVAVPVTVLASGSTDITATLTTKDGSVFTTSDSLVVLPAVAGLTHLTSQLTSP